MARSGCACLMRCATAPCLDHCRPSAHSARAGNPTDQRMPYALAPCRAWPSSSCCSPSSTCPAATSGCTCPGPRCGLDRHRGHRACHRGQAAPRLRRDLTPAVQRAHCHVPTWLCNAQAAVLPYCVDFFKLFATRRKLFFLKALGPLAVCVLSIALMVSLAAAPHLAAALLLPTELRLACRLVHAGLMIRSPHCSR